MLDRNNMPILVDVGNTSIKARFATGDRWLDETELAQIPFALAANVRSQRIILPPSWQQVVVSDHYQGFQLAYRDASKLGVDRWLAMLALRERLIGDGAAILIDAGTATKIEVFNRHSQMGGYILPGFDMALAALFLHADRLHEATVDDQLVPGTDTESTLGRAMPAAVVALIEKLVAQYRPQLVALSGGQKSYLLPHLPSAQCYDNLVLDGLALWWAGQ